MIISTLHINVFKKIFGLFQNKGGWVTNDHCARVTGNEVRDIVLAIFSLCKNKGKILL